MTAVDPALSATGVPGAATRERLSHTSVRLAVAPRGLGKAHAIGHGLRGRSGPVPQPGCLGQHRLRSVSSDARCGARADLRVQSGLRARASLHSPPGVAGAEPVPVPDERGERFRRRCVRPRARQSPIPRRTRARSTLSLAVALAVASAAASTSRPWPPQSIQRCTATG